MRGFRYSTILALAILIAYCSPAAANDFSKVGSAGAQFLKVGMGARYIGLGEASTAVVNDAYAMYWNPAGMSHMEATEFAFTNVNWIEDVALNYVSLATPMKFGGALGVSMTILSIGEMERTTVWEPNGTGDMFDASSYSLAVGYGRSLTDRFAFGLSFKYVSESIDESSSSGFGFDFGTQFNTGLDDLRMGMAISNLGPELKFSGQNLDFNYRRDQDNTNSDPVNAQLQTESYDMPLNFKFGLAYDIMESQSSVWTIAAEAKHPNDNDQQMSLGTEYAWNEMVALRAGYKFQYEEEGLTLGGGVNLNPTTNSNLVIDYAWSDFGRLNSVHRFSFGIRF